MADLQYEKPCLAQDLEVLGDRGRGKGHDLDQVAGRAGGAVVMEPTDNGWVTKAQVTDPAGNVVTLIEG